MSSHNDKPSRDEDEYFAREEVEKVRKLAFQQHQALDDAKKAELRRLHHGKCSNCGLDLHPVPHGHLSVETCFNCKGVFLREGDLQKLLEEEKHEQRGAVMKSLLTWFKKESGA